MNIHPAIFATLFVLVGASDWELAGAPDRICAKDRETCEMAKQAARNGWVFPDLRDVELTCRPSPGCFPPESECIEGYNCR